MKKKWAERRKEEKRKKLYKKLVFSFILITLVLIPVFYYIYTRPNLKVNDFISSISNSKTISGRLDTSNIGKNSCYWIKVVGKEFEIWEIKNTTNCTSGVLYNITKYNVDYPVLISGRDCICNRDYPTIKTGLKNLTGTIFFEVKIS